MPFGSTDTPAFGEANVPVFGVGPTALQMAAPSMRPQCTFASPGGAVLIRTSDHEN